MKEDVICYLKINFLVIVHVVTKTYQTIHFDEMREILGGLPRNNKFIFIEK